MGRRRGLAILTLAAVAGSAAVARADFVLPTPEQPGPNAKLASDALNDALQTVAHRDEACGFRPARPSGVPTHDPPPPELLAAFAVLRRPATPADRVGVHSLAAVGRINVDYVRRARVLPGGTAVYVIPSLDARPALRPVPASCLVRQREALEHRLRGKPAPAQRLARRELRGLQRSWQDATHRTPEPGLFVEERSSRGGAGAGGQGLDAIRKGAGFLATGVGRNARVTGLIPDGVATIDFTFARGRSIGVEGHRVYRSLYRRTVAVVDNIVSLRVPRRPEDALYNRQVWRAADGTVVNTIKPPF